MADDELTFQNKRQRSLLPPFSAVVIIHGATQKAKKTTVFIVRRFGLEKKAMAGKRGGSKSRRFLRSRHQRLTEFKIWVKQSRKVSDHERKTRLFLCRQPLHELDDDPTA